MATTTIFALVVRFDDVEKISFVCGNDLVENSRFDPSDTCTVFHEEYVSGSEYSRRHVSFNILCAVLVFDFARDASMQNPIELSCFFR